MFFRYVYGKIHQYPYLHIIAWGLPRRYFGLLKIFNLQIEYQPQLFLKQYSDAFIDFEPPLTSTASSVQPHLIEPRPGTSKFKCVDEDGIEEQETEVEQNPNGGNSSSRKRRITRKKPVISIKINLDDDLKSLKNRSYSKNLDRILSKRSSKTHLLVIERSSSRRDEYHLKIINNNAINSHPYSKLLKKNREKRKFSSSLPISADTFKSTDVERIPSSNFSSENIFPPLSKSQIDALKVDSCQLKSQYSNDNSSQKNDKINYFTGNIVDQVKNSNFHTVVNVESTQSNVRKESLECFKHDTTISKDTCALALPTHLIPFEEKATEEKPLRNWPIITQLFTTSNFEICKNYLKSFTADQTEDTEIQEITEKVDEGNVKIDLSSAIRFHNATKKSTLVEPETLKQTEEDTSGDDEDDPEKSKVPESKESEPRLGNVDSNDNYILNSVSSTKPKIPPKPTSYSVDQMNTLPSFSNSEENISTKLYTSSVYLKVGSPGDDSPKSLTASKDESWRITYPRHSLTDSLVNMRLLSSSTKTYESIVIPSSQESDDVCDGVKENNFLESNAEKEKDVELSKEKTKRIRKSYIIGIAIAIIISFILGIILFITVSDSSAIGGFMSNYLK